VRSEQLRTARRGCAEALSLARALATIAGPPAERAVEDVVWGLLNAKEFLLRR
jgi:hypothetical protein